MSYQKAVWYVYLKQQIINVVSIFFLAVISNICTIILPLSIGKFIEIAFNEQTNKSKALELLGIYLPDSIQIFLVFFIGIMVIKFIASFMHAYYSAMLGEGFVLYLRAILIGHHLSKAPNEKSSVSILPLFVTEIKTAQRYIIKGVIGFSKDVVLLVIAFYVLLKINEHLSYLLLALLCIYYLLQKYLARRFKLTYSKKRNNQSKLVRFAAETFTIEAQDDEKQEILGKFSHLNEEILSQKKLYLKQKALLQTLTPFLLFTLLLVTMAFLLQVPFYHKLSSSSVLLYILLLITVFPTIRNLLKAEGVWVQGNLAMKKFNKALQKEPKKS